ncbi:MAG: PD-(D/E)XK nuclease family protein [Patescibacteria group bacterium]|nr:PD-(D/E)XK nuclease family protein [Patescibacteria group bacterium]
MAGYRSKTLDPSSEEPFTISRSKIDLFAECPRCAYLDLRLGVKRPPGPSFTLNNAVDELLKKEFDIHRAEGTAHPLAERYGVDAVPLADERLDEWRDALRRGVKYLHQPSNFLVRGGIDDVWVNPKGELIVVDYKATSKKEGPSTEHDLYNSYKRQVEIYQWLFRMNDFKVSKTAYFVYVNGRTDLEAFDGKLEFDVKLISYTGDDSWIPDLLVRMRKTLAGDAIPPIGTAFGGGPCDFCTYRETAGKALQEIHGVARKAPTKNDAQTLFD